MSDDEENPYDNFGVQMFEFWIGQILQLIIGVFGVLGFKIFTKFSIWGLEIKFSA